MYPILFQLAGLGIIGWALLIFLPTWRPTRALAGSAFFPIYIAILYAFGVGALFMEYGFGFVADFGTAEGVTRLLARPEIAIVAWIHILAFDQAIGLAIYRENMRRHYVPIPVQSVILFLTLMFGPLGYLAFVLARVGRLGTQAFGGSARTYDDAGPAPRTNSDADPGPRTSADVGPALRTIFAAYRENWSVTLVALAGVALGILSLLPIAVRGSAIVPPEGDLMKPATFDLAVGIFILSLIPWLPAAFGEPGIRNALLHRGARHHGALDRARRTRVRDAGGRPPRAAGHHRALGRRVDTDRIPGRVLPERQPGALRRRNRQPAAAACRRLSRGAGDPARRAAVRLVGRASRDRQEVAACGGGGMGAGLRRHLVADGQRPGGDGPHRRGDAERSLPWRVDDRSIESARRLAGPRLDDAGSPWNLPYVLTWRVRASLKRASAWNPPYVRDTPGRAR